MQIFKNEIARFMALGVDSATKIANGIVPPAQAAESR
jgi:hypothetical protein